MFNKIKAIKDLRSQAKTMQNALSEITEIGEGAGGAVKVTIDGNQTVLGVRIDGSIAGNKEKIESGVKDAVNNAMKKIQKQMASKMKEMGGLDALKNLGL